MAGMAREPFAPVTRIVPAMIALDAVSVRLKGDGDQKKLVFLLQRERMLRFSHFRCLELGAAWNETKSLSLLSMYHASYSRWGTTWARSVTRIGPWNSGLDLCDPLSHLITRANIVPSL